jgi:hypothetical protein
LAEYLRQKVDVIIDYMELRHLYLFPTYFITKFILRKKIIYWGQGLDLADREAKIKNLAYATEQALCDAIILIRRTSKKLCTEMFSQKGFYCQQYTYTKLLRAFTKNDK